MGATEEIEAQLSYRTCQGYIARKCPSWIQVWLPGQEMVVTMQGCCDDVACGNRDVHRTLPGGGRTWEGLELYWNVHRQRGKGVATEVRTQVRGSSSCVWRTDGLDWKEGKLEGHDIWRIPCRQRETVLEDNSIDKDLRWPSEALGK